MSRFTGKVAIITGSSNGIGRGTAVLFAKEGARVTITGRNVERLEETKQEILNGGGLPEYVNVVVADITDETKQDEIIYSTIQKFGKIDIIVNNAGTGFTDPTGRIGIAQDVDLFDKTIDINVRSVINFTKKAIPHLAETQGEIINVSSIASFNAYPDLLYYAMSKAALDQFTKSTALSLISQGIRVNSVNPGAVRTGIATSMGMSQQESDKMFKYMEENKDCIPSGVCGTPKDIAELIAFLADRSVSSYIVGQTIVADGGSSLVMHMATHDVMKMLA